MGNIMHTVHTALDLASLCYFERYRRLVLLMLGFSSLCLLIYVYCTVFFAQFTLSLFPSVSVGVLTAGVPL